MTNVNKLKLGKRVFKVECYDEKEKPEFVFCKEVGPVTKLDEKVIMFGNLTQFLYAEEMLFKPNTDGMTYYFAGFYSIDSYKHDNGFYKIPVGVLKDYLKSYRSPWK